ncbi:CLUMA_CG018586, isoform A [Clunio marinus]|uniref:CLUMA_CG018586, isoform A n=1 Tax=Clunio marinus TaxID=568069 RepID=A0A1J1IZT2_9DIPT|nr:CLUMA_CG018586, isoform A [Clunio marinus]
MRIYTHLLFVLSELKTLRAKNTLLVSLAIYGIEKQKAYTRQVSIKKVGKYSGGMYTDMYGTYSHMLDKANACKYDKFTIISQIN